MTDIVSRNERSAMMSGIRGKNTRPERLVRQALFRRGFRYRLHTKGLPGKPDLVLKKYRAVIFVNGCFWHRHDCHLFKWPSTRVNFWKEKLDGNAGRDSRNMAALRKAGWRTCVVWECALKGKVKLSIDAIIDRIDSWLKSDNPELDIRGRSV